MKRILLAAAVASLLVGCVASDGNEAVDSSNADATDCTADPYWNLHDACKKKVQPSNRERSLSCPVASTDATGFVTSQQPIEVDTHAFDEVAPFDPKNPVRVVGIVIRRVDGVPHYQYLSNGHHDEVIQPWSSSKWIGVLAAGETLRVKSGGEVGLTASVGGHPIGDLVTDIETYQSRVSSSNGLARWFKNVAGRDVAQSLVTDWLGRTGEEFRGGYGTDLASPGFTFKEANGASVTLGSDDRSGITNLLSMMTEAEALKRLAVWDDEATRPPHLEADDAETVLYGAETPLAYRNEAGGMMRDQAIYMQNAFDMKTVEAESHGRWRIFSKEGDGTATRPGLGNVSEAANVAYACVPVLDAQGEPVPDRGAEFVLGIHATAKSVRATDLALNALYTRIVKEVILPRAQPH
jgi:hypothetical protein